MDRQTIYEFITTERIRQERLKAEERFDFTCADPELGNLAALAVLTEEVGEVARAVMGDEGLVHDGGDLRKELVQVAAVTKDASWLRPALADYILVFRRPGENAVSIHPDITNDDWIEWARPIWYNIRESDTLNVREARSDDDDRHICPLQLGTIERCVRLWSNPGELVLSPFAGIGSEGYESLRHGRRFVGIELKPEYAEAACKNLARMESALHAQSVLPL